MSPNATTNGLDLEDNNVLSVDEATAANLVKNQILAQSAPCWPKPQLFCECLGFLEISLILRI